MNEDEFPRPPYSDDLLADLHAGALDDELAERLWPLVRQDHHAMAVIDRLDAVQARLRTWGRNPLPNRYRPMWRYVSIRRCTDSRPRVPNGAVGGHSATDGSLR